MDYKEEYQKALERAKKGLPIDEVFPELKESDDERIRKFLVERVSNDKANNYNGLYKDRGVRFDDVLAYLEKQKYEYEVFEPVESTLEYKMGFKAGVESVKQKEQKPMEPSDEELQRHQDELYDFKVFAAKQAKEHHISFVHDFEWNNFCAEILSYFNEQPKQEWSEEDEKMLNGIIERGNSEIPKGECGLKPNQVAWLKTRLKSLSERFNIQPKQEWNEEDLKWAEEIRLALFYYSNDRPFIEKLTNWFNNHIQPNPSWKPSEEQIDALEWMLTTVSMKDGGRGVVLKNLINDLKKQM